MYTRLLLLFILLLSLKLTAQEQYELMSINFTGNNEFSAPILKQVIYSRETPGWALKFLNSISSSYGSPPVYFDSSFIETDLYSLGEFYKANGFFNAKFSYEYEIDSADKNISLIYKINENTSCSYNKISLRGFEKLPRYLLDEINDINDLDTTDRYEQGRIENNINKVLSFLYNNGFMKACYDSSVVLIDSTVNHVDVDLYFTPGSRYHISGIDIIKTGDGQEYVSNSLIKNVIAISPEEYYDLEKIRSSQARLSKTGLFNSLKFSGDESDSGNTNIPLRVEGVIGRMNELSPELLMDNNQSSFNLGLGGNFIRKNFFGEARKLTITGKFGIIDMLHFNYADLFRSSQNRANPFQGYIELTSKIEQPYVFNRPILGSLEGYLTSRTENLVNKNTYGTRVSFDFELPEYTFINQLKSYYNLEFFTAKKFNPNKDINVQIRSITSSIGSEFASIKSNDLFFPTKGNNLSFLVEAGISNSYPKANGSQKEIDTLARSFGLKPEDLNLSEQVIFYKTQVTLTNFLSLNYLQTSVLGFKTRVGYIQTIHGGVDLIPLNKTFTAGGSNSVRGWRARQLVPKDTVAYFGQNLAGVRGGTFLLEGSLEYRKRLFGSVGGAIFCDYGSTWNGYNRFRFDDIAVALGFGFRYYSSIAPFRLDFGFKFYDPSNNKLIFSTPPFRTLEVHFGIGEAF